MALETDASLFSAILILVTGYWCRWNCNRLGQEWKWRYLGGDLRYKQLWFSEHGLSSNVLKASQPLAGLCNPYRNGCTSLSADIKSCQAKGIKVKSEAFDLWTTSSGRGGQSSSRSLADASNLDGIDFDIGGGTNQHSDDLARQENVLNSSYAMSLPWCLDWGCLKTGPFDCVLVQFYNTSPMPILI